MKLSIAVGILFSSLVVALALPTSNGADDWTEFKIKYGKTYSSQEEQNLRKKIFEDNKMRVGEHNRLHAAGLKSYSVEINKFSDLTYNEVISMNGYRPSPKKINTLYNPTKTSDLPAEVDWRTKGAVTPVKDQAYCGSCWAFSVVGTLEGQNFLKNGKLVSFSEQNLVDCEPIGYGCWGSDPFLAYDYILKNKGIDTEESYGYQAADATCRFKRSSVGAQISGQIKIPPGNETALQAAVANEGPLSVCFHVSRDLSSYQGGVFYEENCPNDLNHINHCVTLVGYGTENNQDYWLVKNSWGTNVGEEGYYKFARNRGNNCGIATYASYPLVVKA